MIQFEFFKIKSGIVDLLSRFEFLEINYINKDDELRAQLSWFISDQTQLAKVFRRDVDELKRLQQEYMSKLDINSNRLSFDELVQQQINKYYHYRNSDDDDDEEDLDQNEKLFHELDKLHDEHVLWLKKKKKDSKIMAPITERLRMFVFFSSYSIHLIFCFSEELHDHLQAFDVK
jgi:hypothetical protein